MRYFLLLALMLGLTGCNDKPPMAGTPESCRSTLFTALDAWKAGQTYDELTQKSPPVYFVDDDLRRGTRLLDYQTEGDPHPKGTGYSFVVTLTLQDGTGGKSRTKKVGYTAVTEPKHAVTREDRQP